MGERRVIIAEDQQITDIDLNNIGEFGRASLDHVVLDGIEPGMKFTGFPVVISGPLKVTVGAGRLFKNGAVFYRDEEGGVDVDLTNLAPGSLPKIVTIYVAGQQTETAIEPRTFLVDVDTEQTQAGPTATESRRIANIQAAGGIEAVQPTPPALDANVLAVAYVTMTNAGVQSVVAVTENKLVSTRDVANRATSLETWRTRAGSRLDVLDTAISGIQDSLLGLAPNELVFAMARDMARLKERSELPEDYTFYSADRFVDTTESDTANPAYLARVEEGLRFPPAGQRSAQLALLNPVEPLAKKTDNFVLPNYAEIVRERISGRDDELSISQYAYQTVETVLRHRTRSRVRYGVSYRVVPNLFWLKTGLFDSVAHVFRRAGEVWVTPVGLLAGAIGLHLLYRRRFFYIDRYQEEYWDNVVTNQNVSASFVGETFLNTEPGYITAVGLNFTRKGSTGNVTVMICETDNGKPVFDSAIARVALDVADIKLYPTETKVPLPPTYLEKGKRYAIVVASPGNHFLATVTGNKNTNGSLFYSTDGAWAQGDLVKDLSYSLYYAQFTSPRVEMQLDPLQLDGGIADIDVNFDSTAPSGTEIKFEVQLAGAWRALDEFEHTVLNGLPPLLPFRVVLLGTTDVMPGFGVSSKSQVLTERSRVDFKHISTVRALPSSCDTVEVTLRLVDFDPIIHTCVVKVLTGGGYTTVETADATVDEETPDPSVTIRRCTFNLAGAVSSYKIQIEGDTDNVLLTYTVAERYDLAFA